MKRKQSPTWTKKIDREGFQFLAGVRYAKWAEKNIEDPQEAKNFVTKVLPQLFPGFVQGRKMVITNEMLELLKEAGMPMGENFKPGEHKLPENMARIFENLKMFQELFDNPELRKAFPLVAAFGLMIAEDVFSGIALHKFGTRDLNGDQMIWTVGATLEWAGRMLKERKPIDLGKGRVNVELLELIRTIRSHQTKKLRPKELKEALKYAGYHISDAVALRLFEWRAKEKGQL
jgi:hypothetical protein